MKSMSSSASSWGDTSRTDSGQSKVRARPSPSAERSARTGKTYSCSPETKDVVHEPSPLCRPLLDDGEVIRREHRDAHDAEEVAGPVEPLPVDEHPVAPVAHQLQLDQHLAAVVVQDGGAQDRSVGSDADQGVERGTVGTAGS